MSANDANPELARQLIKRFNRVTIVLVFVLVALAGFGMWWATESTGSKLGREDVVLGLAIGLLLPGITYIIAITLFKYFKDVEQSIQFREALGPLAQQLSSILKGVKLNNCRVVQIKDTPWDDLFKHCLQVDLIVQSWDGWMRTIGPNCLQDFFRRGGRINLYIYDFDAKYTESLHMPMGIRMGKLQDGATSIEICRAVVAEIRKTIYNIAKQIDAVYESSGIHPEKGKKYPLLTVKLINCVNWYCVVRFSPETLLISPYAHFYDGVKEAPAWIFNVAMSEAIAKWFEADFRFMKQPQNCKDFDVEKFMGDFKES